MPRRHTHNITTRRNCLRAFSDGIRPMDIGRRYQLHSATVKNWADQVGITKGSNLTDEELDAKIAQWAAKSRKEADTPQRERINNLKFGLPSAPEPPPSVTAGDGIIPIEDYQRAIQEFTQQIALRMDENNTIEGKIEALTGGLLLEQLRCLVGNLPPVASWADVERVMKLTRLNFGLDKESTARKAVDLGVLNQKFTKGKVVDATVVNPKGPEIAPPVRNEFVAPTEDEEFEI